MFKSWIFYFPSFDSQALVVAGTMEVGDAAASES
jgi:hypothetical protein